MMEQSLIPLTPVLPLTAQRTVKRALTLLDRHLRETGVAFTSTQAARDWLTLKMAGLEREEFMVLHLNQQNQLIAHETLFAGSISSTEVHPVSIQPPAFFDTPPVSTSGMAVSAITAVRWFLTFPACWRYTPNAARTATGLMPV